MKRIAVLGSTGSIGINTLKVAKNFSAQFKVVALSAHSNTALLCRQIQDFGPEAVCVASPEAAIELAGKLKPGRVKILVGEEGLKILAGLEIIEQVVLAVSGSAALQPLLAAIERGKDIALANKEALVMAGNIIMRRAKKRGSRIIPIDSEQSAIWQCLEGEERAKLKCIYLTASGGPLRKKSPEALKKISVREALSHPRWGMGEKISVDSATLMNKGLEVIEAMHLFGVAPGKIKVLVHPEAVIHSMVEFRDGVILAQLSAPDMRIPIQYALTYPERLANTAAPGVDFLKLKSLNFEEPDYRRFPALGLAYRAAKSQGTMPAVLNAANEVAVGAFLKKKLSFINIAQCTAKVMSSHCNIAEPKLKEILAADEWARAKAEALIRN